jgi:hypothetical protein
LAINTMSMTNVFLNINLIGEFASPPKIRIYQFIDNPTLSMHRGQEVAARAPLDDPVAPHLPLIRRSFTGIVIEEALHRILPKDLRVLPESNQQLLASLIVHQPGLKFGHTYY